MAPTKPTQLVLNQKFKKLDKEPVGFDFFVSVHDFIAYIESNTAFDMFLKGKRPNKEIPVKYPLLRQIYQGIEDIDLVTSEDLGHDRYVAIRELSLIRKNETSENNSLWRRREAIRKLAEAVFRLLDAHLSQVQEIA